MKLLDSSQGTENNIAVSSNKQEKAPSLLYTTITDTCERSLEQRRRSDSTTVGNCWRGVLGQVNKSASTTCSPALVTDLICQAPDLQVSACCQGSSSSSSSRILLDSHRSAYQLTQQLQLLQELCYHLQAITALPLNSPYSG